MPLQRSFHPREDRLDLSFSGNLDISLAAEVWTTIEQIDEQVRVCILDLTDVTRLFDSGLALLGVLNQALGRVKAQVVVLTSDAETQSSLAQVISNATNVVPLPGASARRAARAAEQAVAPASRTGGEPGTEPVRRGAFGPTDGGRLRAQH